MSLPDLDRYLQSWRCILQHELVTDANQHLGYHRTTLAHAVGDSFASPQDIIHFVKPVTSLSDGQLGPDPTLWIPRTPDLGRLGHLCE